MLEAQLDALRTPMGPTPVPPMGIHQPPPAQHLLPVQQQQQHHPTYQQMQPPPYQQEQPPLPNVGGTNSLMGHFEQAAEQEMISIESPLDSRAPLLPLLPNQPHQLHCQQLKTKTLKSRGCRRRCIECLRSWTELVVNWPQSGLIPNGCWQNIISERSLPEGLEAWWIDWRR